MPSAPTAHFFSAPPVNRLYIPITPPADAFWLWSNHSFSAAPSKPGTGTHATSRHTASSMSVNKIRDLSSGILKQFAKVSAMLLNMLQLLRLGSFLSFRSFLSFGGFRSFLFFRPALRDSSGGGRGSFRFLRLRRNAREFSNHFAS